MARSAAQRASRRLRRQLRPTFPLSQLPPELQLLVLCKCDPTSVRRLLRLNANLRTLFLRYPESCLQQILQHLPRPVENLLCASWTLHNVDNADFDRSGALDLLHQSNLTEYSSVDAHILVEGDHPLLVLEGLAALYEEVEVGVELYAQSLNAAMETFVNPWVQIKPIELSPTEHLRITCAFWILKFYYQLHLKFSQHPLCDQFRQAFVARLDPWQVQQVSSLEQFLHDVGNARPSPLFTIIDDKYSSWEKLSEKSLYIRNFFRTLGWPTSDVFPVGEPVTFCSASQTFRRIPRPPTAPAPAPASAPWDFVTISPEGPSQPSPLANPLCSYGWIYHDWVTKAFRIPTFQRCEYFENLGFFFWDYGRLETWDLVDPREFTLYIEMFKRRVDEASRIAYRRTPPLFPDKGYRRREKERLITQWTRCPIQCSFEEWKYQGKALSEFAASRFPGPPPGFNPTVICRLCGETGHSSSICEVDGLVGISDS